MKRASCCLTLALCTLLLRGTTGTAADGHAGPDDWYYDYRQAMNAAAEQEAMLLVYFRPANAAAVAERFESQVLADAQVREALAEYVCLQLDADAVISVEGRRVCLLDNEAFREMKQKPGVAILDLAHPDASYYGRVVSALPFGERRCYSATQLVAVLNLPPGNAAERWRVYWQRERRPATDQEEVAGVQAGTTEVAATPKEAENRPETATGQASEQPADAVSAEVEAAPDAESAAEAAKSAAEAGESVSEAESAPEAADAAPEVAWLEDYAAGCAEARAVKRMLLIYFHDPAGSKRCRRFETETLSDPAVKRRLQDYVCVRLPVDAEVEIDGQRKALLEHGAFRHMGGRPGVAILDFAHSRARYYGHVVSAFPLTERLWYAPSHMLVILDLPPAELTQRTLIYAVRIHPEHPAGTRGQADEYLLDEARKHSLHQASIRLQGHHQWESRFHRINARLPAGLTACEVCAESWPGEGLVEAAIECVRSWRHSSGHWSAVSAYHPRYGCDLRRGSNGVWYATGIFGRGRILGRLLARRRPAGPVGAPAPELEVPEPSAGHGTPASLVGRETPRER